MKFRIGLAIFTVFAVIVGVAVFLFLPKGGIRNGIFFKTYEGVYAKITGSVTGGANDIELNDLVYGDGSAPTGQELSSWQVNLDFGDGDEITVTIRVENQSADSLYLFFQDNGSEIYNVTKAIYNNGRPYQSGKIIFIGASGEVDDETILTIVFRKEQDVTTNIRYRYELKLTGDPTVEEGLVTTTDLIFEYDQTNNTAIVTGISASSTDSAITIPAKVIKDGTAYTVKGIGDSAFENKTNIASVIFPYSLTSIGNSAFFGCTNLRDVEIPPTVLTIGNKAFQKCTSLETIVIPDSVTSIGKNIFTQCTALTNVEIGRNLTNLASYAFSKCSALQQITIPQTVTSFGTYLFLDCINLTTVNIPSRVTELPDRVFSGCKKLQLSAIPEGITKIGNNALYDCEKITNLTLPTSLTEVSSNTFAGLGNLENLIVPCSFTLTQNSPFLNINVMPDITAYATTDCSIMGDIFCSSNISTITLREGITEILEYAFYYCHFLTEISIPASVTSIGNAAFNECNNLTKVVTPRIEDWLNISFSNEFSNPLFYAHNLYTTDGVNETLITNLVVPSTVTAINNYSLYGCLSITSVTIPASVASIGTSAFQECSGLIKVVTPRIEDWLQISFENYYANPLSNAHNLYVIDGLSESLVTNLYVPNTVTAIKDYAFRGCSSITSVTISNGVSSIGNSAFSNCGCLTGVTIPSSVTSMGNYAFSGCTSLTSVNIGSGVTSIGDSAFSGCSGVVTMVIPASVTSIGRYSFSGCSGLTNITFEDNSQLETIKEYTFNNCSALKHIIIPASVRTIEKNAFKSCSGLESIYIPSSVLTISATWYYDSPFYYCLSILTIYTDVENSNNKPNGWSTCWNRYSSSSNTLTVIWNTSSENYITMISLKQNNPDFKFNGTKIIGYNGNSENIVIPDGVTGIGGTTETFQNKTFIQSIQLPNTLTSIDANAFNGCTGLTKVIVLSLDDWLKISFVNNTANPLYYAHHLYVDEEEIKDIVIPSTISEIKQYAFYGCNDITSVTISEGVTNISQYAFYNNKKLRSVVISSTVERIGNYAFDLCYQLTVIYNLSNKLSFSIGSTGNGNVANYAVVIYDNLDTVSEFIITDGVVYYKDSNSSYIAIGLKDDSKKAITLKAETTQIKCYAFYGKSLISVSYEENVQLKTIGKYAFSNCNHINSVIIPSLVTNIDSKAFDNCRYIAEVYNYSSLTISKGSTSNGGVAQYAEVVYSGANLNTTSRIEVIDGVIYYKNSETDYVVVGLSENRESIILNSNSTKIRSYAFYGNTTLVSITIPNNVTQIGRDAFYHCINLESVLLGNESKLETISTEAFQQCSNLTNISLPETLTTIGSYAFQSCYKLPSVIIHEQVNTINTYAFSFCYNLKTVTIDSANIYKKAVGTSYNQAGSLLLNATTINVLASVVDGDGNTNSFLNDTTKFTKGENAVKISEDNENLYYVYTKVQ